MFLCFFRKYELKTIRPECCDTKKDNLITIVESNVTGTSTKESQNVSHVVDQDMWRENVHQICHVEEIIKLIY